MGRYDIVEGGRVFMPSPTWEHQDILFILHECWRVWPETRTVELLRLSGEGAEVVATYHETEAARSITFPDLSFPVASIFAP